MASPKLHIVSHGPNCLDGAAAAAAVARFHEGRAIEVRFASNSEVNAVLREISPHPGEELWVTDISWNAPETEGHLRALIERGVRLHWFDHHRTAIERLNRGGYQLSFSTRVVKDDFAASKLVYDYLLERAEAERQCGGPAVPAGFRSLRRLIDMADDNDRWLHRVEGSRELGLIVKAMGPGAAYQSFLGLDERMIDTPAMAEARARIREELDRNHRLAEMTRRDRSIGEVVLVSALCDGYAGEIADEWGKDLSRAVFVLFDVRSCALSFRRSPDHDFDLSKLAEFFGGGGHPAASGARLPSLPGALGQTVEDAVRHAVASQLETSGRTSMESLA